MSHAPSAPGKQTSSLSGNPAPKSTSMDHIPLPPQADSYRAEYKTCLNNEVALALGLVGAQVTVASVTNSAAMTTVASIGIVASCSVFLNASMGLFVLYGCANRYYEANREAPSIQTHFDGKDGFAILVECGTSPDLKHYVYTSYISLAVSYNFFLLQFILLGWLHLNVSLWAKCLIILIDATFLAPPSLNDSGLSYLQLRQALSSDQS